MAPLCKSPTSLFSIFPCHYRFYSSFIYLLFLVFIIAAHFRIWTAKLPLMSPGWTASMKYWSCWRKTLSFELKGEGGFFACVLLDIYSVFSPHPFWYINGLFDGSKGVVIQLGAFVYVLFDALWLKLLTSLLNSVGLHNQIPDTWGISDMPFAHCQEKLFGAFGPVFGGPYRSNDSLGCIYLVVKPTLRNMLWSNTDM